MSETENVQSENVAAGEIDRLQAIPGFILPDEKGQLLKDTNMPEYKRLCGLRDAAYKSDAEFQAEHPVETLEAPQSIIAKVNQATEELSAVGFQGSELADQIIESDRDITTADGIKQLRDDIRAEVEQVNELMEGSDIDIDSVLEEPSLIKLEGYKQMRLLAQENYKSLEPLILKDVQALGTPAHKVEQIRNFFATAEPGDPMTSDIMNVIIRHIFREKKERSEE